MFESLKMVVAGALLAAAPMAQAATVVGAPLTTDGSTGVESDANGAATLAQELAVPGGAYLLQALSWWGTPLSGNDSPDTFHISFFGGSTTEPGEPADLAFATFDLGTGDFIDADSGFVDDGGFAVHRYDWTAASALALTGVPLFVSIQGDYAGATDTFLWSSLGQGGTFFQRDTSPTSGWTPATTTTGGGPLALTATLADAVSAVPEPAAWAMMVLGLGLAAGAARSRRAVLQPVAIRVG